MTLTDTDLRVTALERATINGFLPATDVLATAKGYYDFLSGETEVASTDPVGDVHAECEMCDWEAEAGRELTDEEAITFFDTRRLPALDAQQPLPFDEESVTSELQALLASVIGADPVVVEVGFTEPDLQKLLTIVSGFIVLAVDHRVPETDPTFQYAIETMGNILESLGANPEEAINSENPGAYLDTIINKGE